MTKYRDDQAFAGDAPIKASHDTFAGGSASPHFSHSMWPAPVQEADRAGAARRAMWDIGQARRRPLSASSTGPLGCLSAGISSVGRLNRMPRYAFRRPTLYLPRRKSNAGRMECEKCGLSLILKA